VLLFYKQITTDITLCENTKKDGGNNFFFFGGGGGGIGINKHVK
jgi:hypothetical protein